MDLEILNLFCSHNHPKLLVPWTKGGYTYATDGNVAVRIPAMEGFDKAKESRPDVDEIIPNEEPDKWFEIFSLELPMPTECDECSEMIIPKQAIWLNEVAFDQRYLYKLRFLPECKIGPFEKDGAALIKFKGGDGALMPMRMEKPANVD